MPPPPTANKPNNRGQPGLANPTFNRLDLRPNPSNPALLVHLASQSLHQQKTQATSPLLFRQLQQELADAGHLQRCVCGKLDLPARGAPRPAVRRRRAVRHRLLPRPTRVRRLLPSQASPRKVDPQLLPPDNQVPPLHPRQTKDAALAHEVFVCGAECDC